MNKLEMQWATQKRFSTLIGNEIGKYPWDLFLTVTTRTICKNPEDMIEPGRYLHYRYCSYRSIWMVEPFKLAGFHLHGLMYFNDKLIKPTPEEVRDVCNRKYGRTDVQDIVEEKGGSIGAAKYVSKFSGNGEYMPFGEPGSWDMADLNG